ncbi:MAG: hypothetical protein V4657_12410 [Pseudomonadota bacterium]
MTEQTPFDNPVPTLVVKARGFAEQSPLERAARVLAVNNGMDAEAWGIWEEDARAVLMAVREPSEAMLDSGIFHGDEDEYSIRERFKCMIDAALGE